MMQIILASLIFMMQITEDYYSEETENYILNNKHILKAYYVK